MLLVDANPVPTPADAERLLADIWQLSAGRGVGLFLFGVRGRLLLGVASAHPGVEATAAETLADQVGGAVRGGAILLAMADSASQLAAVSLVPFDRRLDVESRTYGWQRSDPLRAAFLALANAPHDTLTGVALALRALPDATFVVSLGGFAAGPAARAQVARLAASFGGVGVRLRRPLGQRRAARRMLSGALRRPVSLCRVEVVSRYWHPPYASDALVAALPGAPDGPAGLLSAAENP